ncbi:HAD-IA family hydrolase [Verrucomicrobiaceae bacterium 227]
MIFRRRRSRRHHALMNGMIIFDFDGTLADSLEAARDIYNRLAPDFQLPAIELEDLPAYQHLGLRGLMQTLGIKPRHVPKLLSQGRLMLREQMADLRPCPDVLTQLPILRENFSKLGILTSNSVENVEIFLRRHGVRHHFDFISTCSKLKGKAKHLRAIARTYSLNPWEMIYVGDEVRDIKAAHKAGVHMAGVTWGFNSRQSLAELEPRWLLSKPGDLAGLMPQKLS